MREPFIWLKNKDKRMFHIRFCIIPFVPSGPLCPIYDTLPADAGVVMKQCLILGHDMAWKCWTQLTTQQDTGFHIWCGNKVHKPWIPWIVIITSWSLTNSTTGAVCFPTKALMPILCVFSWKTNMAVSRKRFMERLTWREMLVWNVMGMEAGWARKGKENRGSENEKS